MTTPPPCFTAREGGVCLAVKLQPRSSRTRICGVAGGELKIAVTAPPVDSAANDALVRFLAEILGCSRGSVQLLSGRTSRHKQVFLGGFDAAEAWRRLVA